MVGGSLAGRPGSHLCTLPRLFLVLLRLGKDVEPQTVGVQVQLVLAAALLEEAGNVAGILDLAELDVALGLLDGLSNQLGGPRLSLGPDDHGLLLLAGLVDNEGGPLGLLLGNLLGLDRGSELGRECQVLCNCLSARLPSDCWDVTSYRQGHIIQHDIKLGRPDD